MNDSPKKSGSFRGQSTASRDPRDLGSVTGQQLDGLQSGSLESFPSAHHGSYHSAQNVSASPPRPEFSELTPFVRASSSGVLKSDIDVIMPIGSRSRMYGRIIADWLIWILLLLGTGALELVPPRAAYIPYADLPRYSFPLLHHDTVPTWSVPLYSIVGPYVVMASGTAMRHRHLKPGPLPYSSLGGELSRLGTTLLTVEFTTALLTNAVKLMVGRPRPNFAERCWPNGEIQWKPRHSTQDKLDTMLQGGVPNCTGKPAEYKEGRKSFPSGHTSWSAAGLSFFSWWLRDYLRPLKLGKRGHAWHTVASYWPMFGAALVGVSRYTDYMHHWQDIFVGYLLGMGVSWIMYHVRWPSGWNQTLPMAERPYMG